MDLWHEKSTINPDFPLRLDLIEPTEQPLHWHEEVEIIYVLEGAYSMELNYIPHILRERDILLIGSGDVHWTVPQPQKSRIAVVKFGLPILSACLADDHSKTSACPLLFQSKKIEPRPGDSIHGKAEKLVQAMIREDKDRKPGFQLMMTASLLNLLSILLRGIPAVENSVKDRKKNIKQLGRLEKTFRYIEREYKRDISLKEAAHAADISVYYFSRFFKEATGKTFTRYLMEYRVNRAKWYLANTRCKVTDVAFEIGYNNTTTFNRIFKEITGMTPTEFKMGNQLSQPSSPALTRKIGTG